MLNIMKQNHATCRCKTLFIQWTFRSFSLVFIYIQDSTVVSIYYILISYLFIVLFSSAWHQCKYQGNLFSGFTRCHKGVYCEQLGKGTTHKLERGIHIPCLGFGQCLQLFSGGKYYVASLKNLQKEMVTWIIYNINDFTCMQNMYVSMYLFYITNIKQNITV